MASNFLLADTQILMDQLRQKSPAFRSWDELIKIAKTNFMEKRNPLDADDRSQIQQALEVLRKTVSVTSNKELMEILENISTRLGLKFSLSPPGNHNACYITHESDCFAINVRCYGNGTSGPSGTTGTIATSSSSTFNNGKVENCDLFYCDKSQNSFFELTKLINNRKWDELEQLLRRLLSILCINNDKNTNLEIFTFLRRLEMNLEVATNEYLTNCSTIFDGILNSSFGIFVPRSAGSLSRLHFFLPPEDMVDLKEENFWTPSFNEFIDNKKGLWADLGAENCNMAQNLTSNLNGNGAQSTKLLPANYFLEFNEPLVLSAETVNTLKELTGLPLNISQSGNAILLALGKKFPDTEINENDLSPLFVILPDQRHKYVINSTNNYRLESHLVTKIRFTNPSIIPQIFSLLRSDSSFLYSFYSCFRIYDYDRMGNCLFLKMNGKNCYQFELSSPFYSKIECLFEHPLESGFISVKFNTHESFSATNVEVLFINVNDQPENLSEVATTVFQKFLSIPVTLRVIIKRLLKHKGEDDDPSNDFFDHSNNHSEKRRFPFGQSNSDDDDDEDHVIDNFMDCDDQQVENRSGGNHVTNRGYGNLTKYADYQSNLRTDFSIRNLRLVTKRYDPQKALDFAMHFDEMALSRNQPNMLDLFKDVDEWEELIPPRPNQKPLRSPIPFTKQRLMQMYGGVGVPAPINLPPQQQQQQVQSVAPLQGGGPLQQQQQQVQPLGPAPTPQTPSTQTTTRSPKVRHVSQTSDTYGDLEQLSALSRSFQNDTGPSALQAVVTGQPIGGGGTGSESDSVSSCVTTPVGDRPAPVLERKSSLQDTIDSVVLGAAAQVSSNQIQLMSSPGHVMQTNFSSVSSSMQTSSSTCRQQQQQQTNQQQAQQQHQQQQAQPPQSVFMQQRSMSVGGGSVDFGQMDFMSMPQTPMSHQQQPQQGMMGAGGGGAGGSSLVSGSPRGSVSSMDVFDFDKSEAFDNSSMMQRWSSTQYSGEPDMQAAMMGYNPDGSMQNFPHQSLYQMRGMITNRGNTVRRRRSRRTFANVGDRNYEMNLKEIKKTEKAAQREQRGSKTPRRPRRPRGSGSSQSSTPPHVMDSNGSKVRNNKFYQDSISAEEDDHSGSKMIMDQFQPQQQQQQVQQMQQQQQQQQQQHSSMSQGQTPPASSMSYGFPSSSVNIMALKDMMSNYGGPNTSSTFKEFYTSVSSQSSQVGLEETFDEQQQQQQQHQHQPVSVPVPASSAPFKATDDNLRRQIHAVVQETIYNENPAFQQHHSNQSAASDDVFGGGGGGASGGPVPAAHLMAMSGAGGGGQNFRPPSSASEHNQSENTAVEFLAQTLPPRSGSVGTNQAGVMVDTHQTSVQNSAGGNLFDNLSKLKQQTTISVGPGGHPGTILAGLTMSAASKRKGSLDDVIGKLTAGVFRSQGSAGSSEESDEIGPNFEIDDYSGVATASTAAPRPASAASTSSFPAPKRMKIDIHDINEEKSSQMDFSRPPTIFEKKDFAPELISTSTATAAPSVAQTKSSNETVSLSDSVGLASNFKESGGSYMSGLGQVTPGQSLKLVIKKKDLKLVSSESSSTSNTTIAKAILTSKLARAAELVTKNAQPQQIQQQHLTNQNKRMSSPLTVEALKSSATVQQLMQRSGITTSSNQNHQKYNTEYRQRVQEKKVKKSSSTAGSGSTFSSSGSSTPAPQNSSTTTSLVNFGTGFAKIQHQQQTQPGGPAETAKLTAKLLEKGIAGQKMPLKITETERKSFNQAVSHTANNPVGKVVTPSSASDLSTPGVPGFPGTEGILFPKSLTGYKIPKIDEKGQQQQQGGPPGSGSGPFLSLFSNPTTISGSNIPAAQSSPQRKPPFQPSHPSSSAKMPKPILKHNRSESQISTTPSSSGASTGAQSQHVTVQKMGADFSKRRPLLPDPMKFSSSVDTSAVANTFGFKASFDEFETLIPFQQQQKGTSGTASTYASSSDPMLIDDTEKSPNLHNSSKDSDNSPGLRIDIDSGVNDDFSLITNRGPSSQENF